VHQSLDESGLLSALSSIRIWPCGPNQGPVPANWPPSRLTWSAYPFPPARPCPPVPIPKCLHLRLTAALGYQLSSPRQPSAAAVGFYGRPRADPQLRPPPVAAAPLPLTAWRFPAARPASTTASLALDSARGNGSRRLFHNRKKALVILAITSDSTITPPRAYTFEFNVITIVCDFQTHTRSARVTRFRTPRYSHFLRTQAIISLMTRPNRGFAPPDLNASAPATPLCPHPCSFLPCPPSYNAVMGRRERKVVLFSLRKRLLFLSIILAAMYVGLVDVGDVPPGEKQLCVHLCWALM